ncbi:phosphatidylglycerophosphate synthase [Micromonospora kangleipakensis]|uniref:Phosphatidylglycerophosphate synthase n=1 Tax=Micromonospora kangleipakensis TaxID=1077942 RepID=A0A4Q8BF88_9ACTN|nr:phosphatidylglycerophosphate synthase [Micromonospora kangleipakensis]
MSTVRNGPVLGLIAQFVLLAGLAGTVGLGAAGWLAGLAYGATLCGLLLRGLRAAGADALGPADRVTLTRAVLVGGVLALTVDAWSRPAPVAVLVPLTAVALALDAVDGRVARRTGTASDLGARFDMEVDAFLILVLSVHLAPAVGGWVLVIGGMRYAFVVASWLLPWMRGTLPLRYWRKVVAAAQGVVLAVASAGTLPRAATTVLVAGALAMLVESFGHDVAWLWRHRPAAVPVPQVTVPVPHVTVPHVPVRHVTVRHVTVRHVTVPRAMRVTVTRATHAATGEPAAARWTAHQPV